jgi:hypothetical protein
MINEGNPQWELITPLHLAFDHREHDQTIFSANSGSFFGGFELQV